MIPFRLHLVAGPPVYEQVVYAAKKAILSGQLCPGDSFPSVRALSKALNINPNTAHKVVAQLNAEGLVEVRPGVGSFVTNPAAATRREQEALLAAEAERLVIEGRRLGLTLDALLMSVKDHWRKLQP